MEYTGITRKVDDLGRVVIPGSIRKQFGINSNDYVEIYVNDSFIYFKKKEDSCILCGNTKNLQTFNDKFICKSCINHIKKG